MKKVLALIITSCLFCSLFTIYGWASTLKGASTKSTKSGKEKTTITYMASQDWVQKAEQDLGAKFEKETGIKVDYQIVPSDQYQNLLKTKLNAGECTDLFCNQSGKFDIVSLLNIEKNGVDLSNENWVKSLDPLAGEQLSVNGKLYGMPMADVSAVWAVCYNKTIFKKLSLKVPKTYAEFKVICKKIKDAGITPIYEPVSDGWHHVLWFLELGGRYEEANPGLANKLNNNKTTFAANKTMLTSLTQLQELVHLGYFGKYYLSNTYADTEKNMANEEYAMTVYNQGLPGQIQKAFPNVKADDFGFFVMPLADNQILNVNPAGPSIFIYSGSKNIDAAKQYLAFLARPENLQYLIDNTPKYNALPFTGVKTKYSEDIKKFYNTYKKHGTVYQTQIKYVNPQWMDIGRDLSAMFTGAAKPIDILKSIDKRRSEAAQAAKDPAWTK